MVRGTTDPVTCALCRKSEALRVRCEFCVCCVSLGGGCAAEKQCSQRGKRSDTAGHGWTRPDTRAHTRTRAHRRGVGVGHGYAKRGVVRGGRTL